MFLFHISSDDDYILDFILQFNSQNLKDNDSFDFQTLILCKNESKIIDKIKSKNYAKNKVYVLLYDNEDHMYRHISSSEFKYVFYTLNFKEIWSNINYFCKYLIYKEDKPTDIVNFTVKVENKGDYFVKENNHTVSNNLSIDELHSFFRNIFRSVNINCFIKDKTMLMYVGNNTLSPQVFETQSLKDSVQNKEAKQIQPKQQEAPVKAIDKAPVKADKHLVNGVFKSYERVYTKNVDKDIINVCVIGDWIKSEELQKLWIRYCQEDNKWNNLRLVDENCNNIDYYIIINRANFSKTVEIPSDRCLVFHMEPNVEFIPWYREFAVTFNSNDLLFYGKHLFHKNNIDWHLSKYHKDFNIDGSIDLTKSKGNSISMVMSSRRDNIGHVMRLKLANELDKCNTLNVDIFGKCDKENFINYKHELPYYCRDEAIFPYKYHFMAENTSIDNYFTEKIIDCILGETLCFYWGCPTLERFIDSRCFIRLPLHDTNESLKIIKNSIVNDEWSKRIGYIRAAKFRLLNVYSLIPRVESILRLNTNTDFLFLSSQNKDEVQKFIKHFVDQSFKNYMYKNIQDSFKIEDLLEICTLVTQTNKNLYVLQHDNCFQGNLVDRLLYDKVCDTLTVVYQQNLNNNIIFFYNDNQDINNIFKMDIFITPDIANLIINKVKTKTYNDLIDFFSDIPLVRVKYIF